MKDPKLNKHFPNSVVITRQNLTALSDLRLKVSYLPPLNARNDPIGKSESPRTKNDRENRKSANAEANLSSQKAAIRAKKLSMLKELIEIRSQVLNIKSLNGEVSSNLVLGRIFKFLNDHYSQLFGFRDILEVLLSFTYSSESANIRLTNGQNTSPSSIGSLQKVNKPDFVKTEEVMLRQNSQSQNIRSVTVFDDFAKKATQSRLIVSSSMKQLAVITSKPDFVEKSGLNSTAILKSPIFKEPVSVKSVHQSNISAIQKNGSQIGLRYMISPTYGKSINPHNEMISFSDTVPNEEDNSRTISKPSLSKMPLIEQTQNPILNSVLVDRSSAFPSAKTARIDVDQPCPLLTKEQKLLKQIIERLGDCNFYFPTYKESYEVLAANHESLKYQYAKLLGEYSKLETLFITNKEINPGRMAIRTENAEDSLLAQLRKEKFGILQITLEKTFEVRKLKSQLKELNRRHNVMFEQVESTASEVLKYRQYVKMAKEEIKKVKNENEKIKLQMKQWVKKHEIIESALESTVELFRNDVASVLAKIATPNISRSISLSLDEDMSPARSPVETRGQNINVNFNADQLIEIKPKIRAKIMDNSRVFSRGDLQGPKPILKKRPNVNNNHMMASPKVRLNETDANLNGTKREAKNGFHVPAKEQKKHQFDMNVSPTDTNEVNRLGNINSNTSKEIYKELQELLNKIPEMKSEWERALINIDAQR